MIRGAAASGGCPALDLSAILDAQQRIRDTIRCTPVLASEALDEAAGATLSFKCENLQHTGAFKARGAANAVFCLSGQEAARGVVTHSSGNHGAALARAAGLRGIPAFIVMPHTAPAVKQAAVRRHRGEIILCEPTLAAREGAMQEVRQRTGATPVHPYNDLRVMAGQGTTAIEFLQQVPDLEMILCPVGGGGLLSGVAVAAKALRPGIRVIGVEPAGADDARRSFLSGELVTAHDPRSIADGLLTTLGDRTFAEIRRHVDDIVTVSEQGIVAAMRAVWESLKVVVEPSGAVAYAAIVEGSIDARGSRSGVILSGGNLDLGRLPWQRGKAP